MKINFPKRKPCIITYQKCKNFLNEIFLTSLQDEVDKHGAFPYKNHLNAFSKICADVLEKHASRKKDIYEPITNLSITLKSRRQS